MKFLKQLIFILLFFTVPGAQAGKLKEQTVYSAAAITAGASSIVYGNLQAVAAATLGADAEVVGDLVSGAGVKLGANGKVGGNLNARDAGTIGADATIGGNLTTGDAATLGATSVADNIMVGGNLTAGGAILVGVNSKIGGDLTSGAVAPANLGASVTVAGNARAGTALTLGANVLVDGDVQAGSGSVALGAGALVTGNARAGTTITGSVAQVTGTRSQYDPELFTTPAKDPVDNMNAQVAQKQQALRDIDIPNVTELATSQAVSRDLLSGVYHAMALTTTAGITLTFKSRTGGAENWLINVDTFIDFGANLMMDVSDVVVGSTITFNAGGHTAIGANAQIIGTIYTGTYLTTGASTTLSGIPKAYDKLATCGGMFTASGAITLGASNIIGSNNCEQLAISVGGIDTDD